MSGCSCDVVGDLNRRRGQIVDMDSKGNARIVKAKVPLAEQFGYVTVLRTLTSGRATSSMEFSNNCNADILPWGKGLILHSYIKDEKTRSGLTLAVSADGGTSWRDILTLQPGPAAYSTMVAFGNGDVGVLYEDGTASPDDGYDIVFARIPRRLIQRAI